VDHICYKCGSTEDFERIRAIFESESHFIYQSIISKRRIAIVKFKKGIDTILGPIYYLELSDQKPDGSQVNGFDHIEIFPTTGSVEELSDHISGKGITVVKVERPHHTTYDLEIGEGYAIKLTTEPLVEKIKREEMKR
jgi:hypothetical protein